MLAGLTQEAERRLCADLAACAAALSDEHGNAAHPE
jgi:hypothetical protein